MEKMSLIGSKEIWFIQRMTIEENNEFNIAYNNIIDNFSSKFDEEFCTEDRINWESILIFNSSEKSEQNESDK